MYTKHVLMCVFALQVLKVLLAGFDPNILIICKLTFIISNLFYNKTSSSQETAVVLSY